MCNAFGQNCGVEGSASPGAVKKYFCFLHPLTLLQQALVSIALTLSSIYLPWRLNGKMTLRMMVMVVLILILQVSEGDDGGVCSALSTGGGA